MYNVGPDLPSSIRDVVGMCAKALGVEFDDLVDEAPERVGQDSRYWLDSSAIKRDVGWELSIGMDYGLAGMVEWGRKYHAQLRDWPTDYQLRA